MAMGQHEAIWLMLLLSLYELSVFRKAICHGGIETDLVRNAD